MVSPSKPSFSSLVVGNRCSINDLTCSRFCLCYTFFQSEGNSMSVKHPRRKLGLKPGGKLHPDEKNEQLVLIRVPADPIEAATGFLKGRYSLTQDLRREHREEARRERKARSDSFALVSLLRWEPGCRSFERISAFKTNRAPAPPSTGSTGRALLYRQAPRLCLSCLKYLAGYPLGHTFGVVHADSSAGGP